MAKALSVPGNPSDLLTNCCSHAVMKWTESKTVWTHDFEPLVTGPGRQNSSGTTPRFPVSGTSEGLQSLKGATLALQTALNEVCQNPLCRFGQGPQLLMIKAPPESDLYLGPSIFRTRKPCNSQAYTFRHRADGQEFSVLRLERPGKAHSADPCFCRVKAPYMEPKRPLP